MKHHSPRPVRPAASPGPHFPQQRRLTRLRQLSALLDSRWRVPGTPVHVGLDAVLGLVPVAGDLTSTALAVYILHGAWRLGTPRRTLALMLGNIALDLAIGSIPIVGDLADVGFRANRRNMALLMRHVDRADTV
jgi:hypothetical protein